MRLAVVIYANFFTVFLKKFFFEVTVRTCCQAFGNPDMKLTVGVAVA
jgi:hypothetical protein